MRSTAKAGMVCWNRWRRHISITTVFGGMAAVQISHFCLFRLAAGAPWLEETAIMGQERIGVIVLRPDGAVEQLAALIDQLLDV